jgi:superfamily II DNA or RNA helicase
MEISDIIDFLPIYVNTDDENFYDNIYTKKEFYDNKLTKIENKPEKKGDLMKHQKIIARFFSSRTIYDRLLLYHEMGSGKTCAAIAAIEQIKSENNNFKGALYLAKGEDLIDNFINELINVCTDGRYIPENSENLTSGELKQRQKKSIKNYYSWNTFQKFAKYIQDNNDLYLQKNFDNMIIVIDEIHNLRIKDKKKGLDIYKEFFRFLHVIKNSKILLLSGTPMKDNVEEISSVMNLLLPYGKDKKPYILTGEDFINKYFNKKNNILEIKNDKVEEIKKIFKGKVSFLNSMQTDIKKEFIGEKLGNLNYFKVSKDIMSDFQQNYYKKAYRNDINEKSIYNNSRQCSLFIFPDGSYGNKGYQTYIRTQAIKSLTKTDKKYNFYITKELKSELLSDGNEHDKILNKIQKYSSKYTKSIKNILRAKKEGKSIFIYNEFVKGGGLILFSCLLELFGFRKANGSEKSEYPRYALITSETTSKNQTSKILETFNKKNNMNGKIINIILGSKKISEGFSLKNIQIEEIHTPWFNYSETSQAIARGYRLFSHKDLIESGITPVVEIFQRVSLIEESNIKEDIEYKDEYNIEDIEEDNGEDMIIEYKTDKKYLSIDLQMYEWSEIKDISIKRVERIMKEAAFDCSLNYERNYKEGYDYQRECEYLECEYKCDGITYNLNKNLNNNKLNYSTYQLYYNQKDIYSIINNIINMFKKTFKLNYKEIVRKLSQYTDFEVLSSLYKIINENIEIINKFGFICYLREEDNIYFLIDNLSVKSNIYSSYYTENINIKKNESFSEIIQDIYINKFYPEIINKICKINDETELKKLIKKIPLKYQEILLENSLTSFMKDINKNVKQRKIILNYFKDDHQFINEQWVSSLLYEDRKILRCMDNITFEWNNCDEYTYDIYLKQFKNDLKRLEQNPYGYYGQINPNIDGIDGFCIRDVTDKDKLKSEKLSERTSGRRCKNLGKKNLVKLVKQLHIPIPENVKIKDIKKLKKLSESELKNREIILKIFNKIYNKFDKPNNSKTDANKNIFNQEEIKNMSINDLIWAIYWGDRTVEKQLCKDIKDWFVKENLIIKDKGCGMGTKKKKKI